MQKRITKKGTGIGTLAIVGLVVYGLSKAARAEPEPPIPPEPIPPDAPVLIPGDYILTAPSVPSEGTVGEVAQLSLTATNRTATGGTVTTTIKVNGESFSQTVYVGPYSGTVIVFDYIPQEPIMYTILFTLVNVDGDFVPVTRYLLVKSAIELSKPQLVNLTVPSVPSGGSFTVKATAFLPRLMEYDSGWYGGEWLPAGTIVNPLYILRLYCPNLFYIEPWTNEKVYFEVLLAELTPDDLTAPDAIYNLGQELKASWPLEAILPGRYRIEGVIVAHTGWWDGRGWGTTWPTIAFGLGVVGELEIT